ncbi:hypothetical protein V9T40_003314 [Parthenolecanium corni]|uniref:Uncharacterized protein n=1 Tax=Parthenolecanium corni TaxID=536013 RepID=A0AAN9TQG1_9HEMI
MRTRSALILRQSVILCHGRLHFYYNRGAIPSYIFFSILIGLNRATIGPSESADRPEESRHRCTITTPDFQIVIAHQRWHCLDRLAESDGYPAIVEKAAVESDRDLHLENSQRVYFNESNVVQCAASPPATTLTSFFLICQSDTFAQNLLYAEMPRYYTWNASTKKFQHRKQGNMVPGYPDIHSTDALGRIYTVHPKSDECFYLRLLLVNVRGPTSFVSLQIVNGKVCPTFCAACQELHLLENNSHWDITIAEVVISASPNQIRTLFAIIIEPINIEGLALRFVYGHCEGKTN